MTYEFLYFILIFSILIFNKKPKRLENSQLLREKKFELILEQCVANYYGDNTIAK